MKSSSLGLFLISVLVLFLEVLLIRWIGTEINIFAYLQNAILIVCFMGLALGCLTCRQPIVLRNVLVPLSLLVVLLSLPITKEFLGKISWFLSALNAPVGWSFAVSDSVRTTIIAVSAGLAGTFALMLLVCQTFVPLGRLLGRLMDNHPRPILAYSVNIAGSLAGIWLFVMLSVFYQPPGLWFLVVGALLLYFILAAEADKKVDVFLLAVLVGLSWFAGRDTGAEQTLWSPYQKLTLYKTGISAVPYYIKANNTGYQWIANLDAEDVPLDDTRLSEDVRDIRQYDIPVLLHPNPKTILIAGAGTGNDIAGALRHPGVLEITAVEIDSAIIHLGQQFNPLRPYQSPKVSVINNDARSFFASARKRYDVIVFGLLDSHTMTGMTNARLDHYVYTLESLKKVKSLLREGGVLVLKFLVVKPYIADRLARLLDDIFGEAPLIFRLSKSTMAPGPMLFIAGDLSAVRNQIRTNNVLAEWIAKWQDTELLRLTHETPITTDDWPYLYLSARYIPVLYYLIALMILALLFYAKWRFTVGGLTRKWEKVHWHFFFLGAAFLLLEVQNISKAAVLFGNTWYVNAVIISGILLMILLANLTVARCPGISVALVYSGLIATCIGLYLTDLAWFGFLPYYVKEFVIGVLTSLPVFFGGVVFIRSFANVKAKDIALGANLVGALIGGLLQSVTFVTGIQALLLIVTVLYSSAMLCDPRLNTAR